MKKFFGNLWVMVASVVLLVFVSTSLICVLAQPLFCMGNYYSKKEFTTQQGEEYVNEAWVHFNLNNTMEYKQVVKNETTGETKERTDTYWYYKSGETLFQIGNTEDMTKEEYKEAVDKIKNMSEKEYNAYRDEMGYVITWKAFYLSNESSLREDPESEYYHIIYINKTKIPTVIVLSVVETLVFAFATTSVICFILNKKNKPAKVEETPAA